MKTPTETSSRDGAAVPAILATARSAASEPAALKCLLCRHDIPAERSITDHMMNECPLVPQSIGSQLCLDFSRR